MKIITIAPGNFNKPAIAVGIIDRWIAGNIQQ
jgi:hypothetical protein